MMVEVSEEGIVFCYKVTCDAWMESETCCDNCPIDKLFTATSKHFANKSNQTF